MRKQALFLIALCALLTLVVIACGLPFAALSPTDVPPTAFPTWHAEATQAPSPNQTPSPDQPTGVPDEPSPPQVDATAKVDSLPPPKSEPTRQIGATPTPGAADSLDDIGGPPSKPGSDSDELPVEDIGEPPPGSGPDSDQLPVDDIGGSPPEPGLDDDVLPTSQAGEGEATTSLTLVNDADRDVCYVHISPSDSDSWGEDWLDAEETIPPGWTMTFYLEPGTYDLMAQACDGEIMGDLRNASLEGEMQWTIGGDGPPAEEPEAPEPQDGVPTRVPVYPTPTPASVSEFLCCGTTPGETGTIWSVNYPANWFVTLLPNNPQQFYGALFTDPQGKVTITFIPGSNTEPGNELDTGNVDDFLNRFIAIRQREEEGYEEVARNPLPGVSSGRLWVGTWGSGADRGWEAYLVTVDPMLQVAPGLPQGYLTMYGFRAPSRDWANAERTFDQMWNSMRVKKFGGNEEGLPPREPNQKPIMIRWCPKCCDWVAVEADHEDWGCPHCGRETELWETPCE